MQSDTLNPFNNFQLQFAPLPPPWRHLLLQREESDGNQFEKILLRHTVYGQLSLNQKRLLIQNH